MYVFVSATNHGYDSEVYLSDFPFGKVGEIHLAGHAEYHDETGALLLIDSHDSAVSDPVWQPYRSVLDRLGPIPTLIEWDANVPSLNRLMSEAAKANEMMDKITHQKPGTRDTAQEASENVVIG